MSATVNRGLLHFLRLQRTQLQKGPNAVRVVYRSEFVRNVADKPLEQYVADRAPLFYRRPGAIAERLREGFFLSAIRETLLKLPTSQSFQESHFGEIVACTFAEEVLQLRKLYSKLSLLTAQNANAYKMDLVMYDPSKQPIEFVFGEVKCSPKCAADGLPANHHKSCYADIFNSLRNYSADDCQFDLTAAGDHLDDIPAADREKVREGLKPYSSATVRYMAVALIDTSTFCETEAQVLLTRNCSQALSAVDIVCLETFPQVSLRVHEILKGVFEKAAL